MGDKFVKKYPDGILKEMSLPLPLGLTRCSVDTLHLADDIQQLRVFVAVAHKLVVDLKACIVCNYNLSLPLNYRPSWECKIVEEDIRFEEFHFANKLIKFSDLRRKRGV